ncbi:glycoside hydrolase [Setomelanomma holmii]|uniref:alpha-L-fucosidase n=1 Tax=Setomelanomma holmii TaxID=210430 RepID=A0A9P4GWE8_9PLEO|nr:glycoside hydrolase [Setomelanomma holmii]
MRTIRERTHASKFGITQGTINTTFADNSTASATVLVPAWWSWPYPTGGDLVFPYRLTNDTWLDSSEEIVSLQLPNVTGGAATDPGGAAIQSRLHIFALTLVPAAVDAEGPVLTVQYARSTQKWVEGSNRTQIYEVVVSNIGFESILKNHSVAVSVDSEGVKTIQPGYIKRLSAGDQVRVTVGVEIKDGVAHGCMGPASIVVQGSGIDATNNTFNATYGIKAFDNSKYGIFIHWGVYAVPAWGNSGKKESYVEWYWWALNSGPDDKSQTYEHHLATHGPNVVYDDFIQNFTASNFDSKEWVDLFADAGANYFVQVGKHHDGYAIFNLPSNVSDRTSVKQMPHRNLLQELFNAADQYQPHLHKATYFSLPEWFHPDFKGIASRPGCYATNPFTNNTLPYTGYVPVCDYVSDAVLPEMRTLADMGTEIMWCDIGGPNRTAELAATWYNALAASNKQALMNARCGLPGDFDTPEYARYPSVQARKWETNQGMDPDSYGYNAATPLSEYMNASTIVKSLVDIVSKNGNLLLDVGPMEDGANLSVIQDALREGGKSIKDHGEAVFDTTYWHVTPQEGENVRFTTSKDKFYVLVMEKPVVQVVLESPVPWVVGDVVKVIGGGKAGEVVWSSMDEEGRVVLDVSEDVADADEFVWVFAIEY